MAAIAVVVEALEAAAVRLRSSGSVVTGIADSLRPSGETAGTAGDPAVESGLQALVTRLDQTAPALAGGHDGLSRTVTAAAASYRATDTRIGGLAATSVGPVGMVGTTTVGQAAAAERWGQALIPDPAAPRAVSRRERRDCATGAAG
jgi:hypothetical protein